MPAHSLHLRMQTRCRLALGVKGREPTAQEECGRVRHITGAPKYGSSLASSAYGNPTPPSNTPSNREPSWISPSPPGVPSLCSSLVVLGPPRHGVGGVRPAGTKVRVKEKIGTPLTQAPGGLQPKGPELPVLEPQKSKQRPQAARAQSSWAPARLTAASLRPQQQQLLACSWHRGPQGWPDIPARSLGSWPSKGFFGAQLWGCTELLWVGWEGH